MIEPTHGIKNQHGYWLTEGSLRPICGSEREMLAIVENHNLQCKEHGNEGDLRVVSLPEPIPGNDIREGKTVGPYCSYKQLVGNVRDALSVERGKGFWPMRIAFGSFLWEIFEEENKQEPEFRMWGIPVVFDAALRPNELRVF